MGDITLRKALDDYKTVYMPYRNFAERTRVEYLNDLEALVEYLEKSGHNRVGDLKLAQIERYLAELEHRGFAGATRKRKTVTIRSFLKFLYQDRYIESDIARHIIPPFIDSKMPSYLTKAEYDRLRKACASKARDAAIIELLLQTGIRLSELTHLSLDDVEFSEDGGLIRIKAGRGREGRMLPLNSKACNTLKAYLAERRDTGDPILFLNRFGEPLGDRGIQKMLGNYLRNSGLERVSVHTLRHTFGIHHALKGTSAKTIQEVMGHKDIRSTSIYTKLAKELVQNEIQEHAL